MQVVADVTHVKFPSFQFAFDRGSRVELEIAMATVVGVLDQDSWSARVDNIVVADPDTKTLTWIPRDLWCLALGDRVNEAFAFAGLPGLICALRYLGIHCEHGLVLRRGATERAAASISVEVAVDQRIDFIYPLAPTRPIEEGHKLIYFHPPSERLEGERIHQWIGARMAQERKSSDLERIQRQQVFLLALLQQSFDFKSLIADPKLVRISDKTALAELASVDSSWRMETVTGLRYERIDGKSVLVKGDEPLSLCDFQSAQLAAIVIALGTPFPAVEAVRSLLCQSARLEVLVVSCGVGMAKILSDHGIDVPVIESETIMSAGAAKNIGIKATAAPYVAFLGADCIVRPDWARRRSFFHLSGASTVGGAIENAYPNNASAWADHFVSWPRRTAGRLRSLSYDRRLFQAYGLFREDLANDEEKEFHKRLPRHLRPVRKVNVPTMRCYPTGLRDLLSEQFSRGVREVSIGNDRWGGNLNVWRRAWRRALDSYLKAKKNQTAILLAIPIIPIALAARCVGSGYWQIRQKWLDLRGA